MGLHPLYWGVWVSPKAMPQAFPTPTQALRADTRIDHSCPFLVEATLLEPRKGQRAFWSFLYPFLYFCIYNTISA